MSVAGIVLAAGSSRRLGRPKQMLQIGGETLLGRTVRVAKAAGLRPLHVVVDPVANWAADWASSVEDPGCEIVANPDAEDGLASSIRAGVRAALTDQRSSGAVLLTCDQILLTAGHLLALCRSADRVAGSRYAGKIGVPAYFPRASFASLLALHGDAGARALLAGASYVEAEELALDIDTEADVKRAQAILDGVAG